MKWWNDLWLNEGVTIYFEYFGVNSYFPEWRMMEQFIIDKTQPALALDALTSSHPITAAVNDPSETETIFDTISYSKVSLYERMMKNNKATLNINIIIKKKEWCCLSTRTEMILCCILGRSDFPHVG